MTSHSPLAERMRPKTLRDIIGQQHLLGENGTITKSVRAGFLPSMILWGPPGVGKTTIAQALSEELERPFYTLSAISSGVKEVREVIAKAAENQLFNRGQAILFIDEIHRFSKSQQDSLLGAVEKGTVTLIGATTENPSFEVIRALLSRCQVFILEPLSTEELHQLLEQALKNDPVLSTRNYKLTESDALIQLSGGDGRKLLNLLELSLEQLPKGEFTLNNVRVKEVVKNNPLAFEKSGEAHYDTVSAFIKSIRGSDPNAAVYYLARMIEGGEDPNFIARRLVILAAEDIGLANPNALLLAQATQSSVHLIGWPESRIILSECAIYLATSPKSNSAYKAIQDAQAAVRETGALSIPMALRNAPTDLMKKVGYGDGYQYAHDHPGNFTPLEMLPEEIRRRVFYSPGDNPKENQLREQLKRWWKDKYKY